MAIGGPKINAKTNLNAWNAESFVAVACLGTANYLGYECDRYLCMDDKDGLWNIFIYYGKDESGTVGYYFRRRPALQRKPEGNLPRLRRKQVQLHGCR